nr:MBOAT family O-acyltransferase [uncultured Rhodopila sp.]
MTVVDTPFLLVAVATVLALRVPALRAWRMEVLGIFSLAFAGRVVASAGDAAMLLVMAATGWIMVRLLSRSKSRLLLAFGIGCVLTEFLVSGKILPYTLPWHPVARAIGLSYVMFRVLHVMVDAHGNELPAGLKLRHYVCYLFCYLTFLAGPIQGVRDFVAEIGVGKRTNLLAAAKTAVPAIISGYFKYTFVAATFFAFLRWSQEAGSNMPAPIGHAVGWLSFAAYLYASFSGYTDIVRGIGSLIDLDLPANFNRPFATINFLDFWSRWHISLSDWFKLYVFNPTVKAMISTTGRPALVPYLGAIGYFITFFLMGLWHGVSWRFVLYGVCLGAGVCINKLYQLGLSLWLGRSRTGVLTRRWLYTVVARSLALGFFIVMLGFLWISAASTDRATLEGWAEGAGLVVVAVLLLTALVMAMGELTASARRLWAPTRAVKAILYGVQAVAVILYVVVLRLPVPPLLYEYF